MKSTIDANMGNVSDEILKMYDLKTLKGLTKPFIAKYGSDMEIVSEKAEEYYSAKKSTLKETLEKIDTQINTIKQNNSEIISQSDTDTALQRLKQIEEAYNRILNKNGTVNKKANERIQTALNYTPGEQSLTILKKGYEKSLISGENWEVQYQWLLKFVKEYEAYANSPDANSDRLKKYSVLYEQLKPMATNAENMLRNILNMANNIPLVDINGIEMSSNSDKNSISDNTSELTEQDKLVEQYNQNKC